MIQHIGTLPRQRQEVIDRRKKVLADWMAMGHEEQALRDLAKGPLPLQPAGQDEPPASERPSRTKRR